MSEFFDDKNEATIFLQKYLQIDTSHPKPDYQAAINFFKEQAEKDGFKTSVIQLSSGFKVLVVTLEGADSRLPAIALNHHMDVVSAGDLPHKHPPFLGHVDDGFIYGRGTQDMKGVGVTHYLALKKIKLDGLPLKRTIHLFIVPDEECGGFKGVGQLVETPEFKNLNIGYVLDEGIPSGKEDQLCIKISERKPLQVEFACKGAISHSARTDNFNSAHELILFLSKLADFNKSQQIKSNTVDPGLLVSAQITSLQAGDKATLNTIPGHARATIDIRVPFNITVKEVIQYLKEILKKHPKIKYKILASAKDQEVTKDRIQSNLYKVLSEIIKDEGLRAVPFHAQEASDLRFYLSKGVEGLGFTPFSVAPNLHGINECISLNDLMLGIRLFYKFLKRFCT